MKNKDILKVIIIVILILSVLHFIPKEFNEILYWRFNLDKEANVPTWFSSSLLLSISLSCYLIYRNQLEKRFLWILLLVLFAFLSLDETARIHEIIDQATNIKWVYVYLPILGSIYFFVAFLFFKGTYDQRKVKYVFIGMTILGLGGLGGELIDHYLRLSDSISNHVEIVFEEASEMLGAALILYGCLEKLSDMKKIVS